MNSNLHKYLLGIFFILFSGSCFAADKKTDKKDSSTDTSLRYVCGSDLYYTWLPKPPPTPEPKLTAKGVPTPQPTIEPPKPVEEFYARSEETASLEEEAKTKLSIKIPTLRAEALKACEDKHQATGQCVAIKVRSFENDYRALDFEARRTFLDSIKGDCQQMLGRCTETRAGDITCSQKTTQETASQGAGEKEKKDKK